MGWLSRRIFGISPQEATFIRRGFRGGPSGLQDRLEGIGRVFLHGYHSALEVNKPKELARRLDLVESEWRGFAFEGAAMGLNLLDQLTPWARSRLQAFLDGPGAAHAYMVHVGAGWALARLRRRVDGALRRFDPLLGWLAVDGYGFHEGYFHWQRYTEGQEVPHRLSGYSLRVFDQGLGRSLWFIKGADVASIHATIAAFSSARHADLWSGVGLACAYAGGVDQAAVEALGKAAESHKPQLAQGAAFAAKARQRAGNPAAHTELACQVLWGLSADAAAGITDAALVELPSGGAEPAYQVWRQRIQAQFARKVALT